MFTRQIKQILLIILATLLLLSCGGGGGGRTGSGITIPATGLSLGDPQGTSDTTTAYYQSNPKNFAWANLLSIGTLLAVEPLATRLFRGLFSDGLPAAGGFSEATANQYESEHNTALNAFQSRDDNGIDYNVLVQLGSSQAVANPQSGDIHYGNAGHVVYGLWSELWVHGLDVKRKVYTASVAADISEADRKSWKYTYSFAGGSAESFIGYSTEVGSVTIRSAFVQTNNNGTFFKEAIDVIIDGDAVNIKTYKQGTENVRGAPGATYTVLVNGVLDASGVQLSARLLRPRWDSDINNGARSSDDKKSISLLSRVEVADGSEKVRVQYRQCPLATVDCVLAGGTTKEYTINANNMVNIGTTTITLPTPTIILMPATAISETTFRLSF